jgi:hypothetical protein
VDAGLRSIGLSSLADEGLKVLNRAAEDAVKETHICGCGNQNVISVTCQRNLNGERKQLIIYKTVLYRSIREVQLIIKKSTK